MRNGSRVWPWVFGIGTLGLLGWAAWSNASAASGSNGEIEPKSEQPSRACAPITARAFYLGLLIVGAFESAMNWGLFSIFRLAGGRKEIAFGLWQANADAGTLGLLVEEYTKQGGQINLVAFGDPKNWGSITDESQLAAIKQTFEATANDPIMRRAQVAVFVPRYFLPACAMLQSISGNLPVSFAVLASASVQLGTERTQAFLQQAANANQGERAIMLAFCDLYINFMAGIQSRGSYGFDLTDRPRVLKYLVETDPQIQNPHTIHGVAIQTAALQ